MPCDSITTVQLKLKPEIVRMEWLNAAITRCGHITQVNDAQTIISWRTGSYNKNTGILTERSEREANRIRQTYAAELTRRTLGRAGWTVRTVEEGVK